MDVFDALKIFKKETKYSDCSNPWIHTWPYPWFLPNFSIVRPDTGYVPFHTTRYWLMFCSRYSRVSSRFSNMKYSYGRCNYPLIPSFEYHEEPVLSDEPYFIINSRHLRDHILKMLLSEDPHKWSRAHVGVEIKLTDMPFSLYTADSEFSFELWKLRGEVKLLQDFIKGCPMYPVDDTKQTSMEIAVFRPSYHTLADINAYASGPTDAPKNKNFFESHLIRKTKPYISGCVIYTDLYSCFELKQTQTVWEQARWERSLHPSVGASLPPYESITKRTSIRMDLYDVLKDEWKWLQVRFLQVEGVSHTVLGDFVSGFSKFARVWSKGVAAMNSILDNRPPQSAFDIICLVLMADRMRFVPGIDGFRFCSSDEYVNLCLHIIMLTSFTQISSRSQPVCGHGCRRGSSHVQHGH
jgi:hypothetical protein